MNIGGFQKFSLIDYPGKISSIIFTQGCNFNCVYCHNNHLIETNINKYNFRLFSNKEIFNFLKKRIGQLDAVVITGGEPTLQPELVGFIEKIKKLGFLVKLDTNGSRPEVLEKVISIIDFVAMDIKAPFRKYELIANCCVDINKIKKSINIITSSGIDYQFRTTVPKTLLGNSDLKEIEKLSPGVKFQECNGVY